MCSNLTIRANYIDQTRPTIRIITPVNWQKSAFPSISLYGSAQDNVQVAAVYYRVNSNVWTNASGTVNWKGTAALTDGTNSIDAYAADATGRYSPTNTVKVI
jgi:hypothetical protein